MRCSIARCKNLVKCLNLCPNHYNKLSLKRTPKGKLMSIYTNMQCRVSGMSCSNPNLYIGLPILSRKAFYAWAINHPTFIRLFNNYISSNFSTKMSPSIDRINPDLGYTLKNMEWVTFSENVRRSNVTRKRFK